MLGNLMNSGKTSMQGKSMTGATLIEVMIALVIMSIGLLGLASLQLSGVSTSNNSEKRTQATIVANDLIERMRANPAGVTAGNYAAINYGGIDCTSPPTSCENLSSSSSGCNPAEVAAFDGFATWCAAKNNLQSGSLTVSCTDNTGVAATCSTTSYRMVSVNWSIQTDDGTKAKTLSMIFRPLL